MEPVYTPVVALVRGLFAAQGLRFTITGEGNVPRAGGAVMVINHSSYLDFMFAGLAARPAGRLVRFMAKESVFRHRLSGPLLRAMGHIPVDRDAGAASFREALRSLQSGEIVGVFPEATISRSFELKEFKSGAARLAMGAGVPLLPVVVWGGQRVWTKGHPRRLGRARVPIHIAVGEPVAVPKGSDANQVTADLRATMQHMLEDVQRAYPPMPERERHLLPRRLGGTAPTLEEAAELEAADVAERRRRRAEREALGGS